MKLVANTVLLFLAVPLFAGAQQASISGKIVDPSGAAVPNANISYHSDSTALNTTSRSDGTFSVTAAKLPMAVSVNAPGFKTASAQLAATGQTIILQPDEVSEIVEVTSTRMKQEIALRAADISVLDRETIVHSPSQLTDDVLRNVPGFQLFRRTSSVAANPTTQGVSLRGLSASGASRALVIEDLVPLNDPFGGWVYWDRMPKLSLERAEVVRSGESDVYGRDALGGVVQLIPVSPDSNITTLEASGGSRGTANASGLWSHQIGRWGFRADGAIFRWDGYIPVVADQRGAVDTVSNLSSRTGEARVERRFGKINDVFLQGSWSGEERQNGTFLQANRTAAQSVVIGSDFALAGGMTSLRAFADWEHFHQSFSSIALDRNSELPTRLQFVPVQRYGLEGQWVRSFHHEDSLIIGASASEVDGVDDEVGFITGSPQFRIVAGGVQKTTGVFGHLSLKPISRLFIGVGARFDAWEDTQGFSRRENFTGPLVPRTDFNDKVELEASPRVSVGYSLTSKLMLSGAAYKAFRPPTLNELYRGFRVGNVMTLANQGLASERLNGVEGGFDLRLARIHLAQSFFYNELNDAIANVTLATMPALITRQRQNAGLIRSRGIDLVVDGRLAALHWNAGYEFADSSILSFPTQPQLVGKLTSQVPRHSWTVGTSYLRSTWDVTAEARGAGQQFDDDLNQFPLGSFAVLNLSGSKQIYKRVSIFAAIENALEAEYATAKTPVTSLGPPITVRAGLRLSDVSHRR
ncbi:MAG: TonB-dependent receptor domain-containing protein [Terriglobales bacterium]